MNTQRIFNNAPEWATHHAIDENGVGHWFSSVPVKGCRRWHADIDSDTVSTMESGKDRLAPYSAWGGSLVECMKPAPQDEVVPVPPSATPEQILGRMVENNRHGLPTFDGIEMWGLAIGGSRWIEPTVYDPEATYRVATIVRSLNGVILPRAVTVKEMKAAKVDRGYHVADPLASGNSKPFDAAFAHAGAQKNELKLRAIRMGLVYHNREDAVACAKVMTSVEVITKYNREVPEAGE